PVPLPRTLRIAAVQMKFAPTIAGNLEKIRRAIQSAARQHADAILFPECATTGYAFDFASLKPHEIAAALDTIATLAQRFKVNVLIGSAAFSGRRLQNCLLV